jgi:glycosyltransferase involved in cell wall biosynthesis
VTEAPTFSVVMAAYNAADTVDAAIGSVLGQTRRDWELIVVDDGSSDSTAERVAAYAESGRVRLVSQENQGLGNARNAGIREMRGRFLSILDSDDLWLPTYLEVMGETLERDPEAAMAYTDAWVLDDETGRVMRTSAMFTGRPPDPPPRDPTRLFLELLERNFVYVSATIRRSILDEVGLYDPAPVGCEDYELSLRIAASGHRIVRAPGRLAVYRNRRGSLSSDVDRMAEGRRQVYRIATSYHLSPRARRAVQERLEDVERERAAPGGTRLSRSLRSARGRLGRVAGRLLWRRHAYPQPPEELAALLIEARAASPRARPPARRLRSLFR